MLRRRDEQSVVKRCVSLPRHLRDIRSRRDDTDFSHSGFPFRDAGVTSVDRAMPMLFWTRIDLVAGGWRTGRLLGGHCFRRRCGAEPVTTTLLRYTCDIAHAYRSGILGCQWLLVSVCSTVAFAASVDKERARVGKLPTLENTRIMSCLNCRSR